MCFEGNFEVSEDQNIMNMIYKKTGALIAAATKAGAIIGGGNTRTSGNSSRIWYDLVGLAFQIQDDYLDVVSDEENLGKPVGSDIIEGKMTLMVVQCTFKCII